MNMGAAVDRRRCTRPSKGANAAILNVGNPQCVIFVDNFDFEWAALGARIEYAPAVPQSHQRLISFRCVDRHTLDVRFFERGAGETMSSGTGSTGAAAAALPAAWSRAPLAVLTPAGPLDLRWEGKIFFWPDLPNLSAR